MKRLEAIIESCWQCPYIRFDEFSGVLNEPIKGWYCSHPDLSGELIIRLDSKDIFNEFNNMYPNGFPIVCPWEDVE